jgi:hypothetical protein
MKCEKKGVCESKTKLGECANQLSECEYKGGAVNGKERGRNDKAD